MLPIQASDAASVDEGDSIVEYLRSSALSEVIISAELDDCTRTIKRLAKLRELPMAVHFVPIGSGAKILARPSFRIGDTVCLELQREPLDRVELLLKRIFDVAFSGLGLILLAPLLIICAVAIKFDSPGPIFFRQKRRGFNGQRFDIWKFRTMTVLENGESICQARPNDRRITRLGRLLRRTSIDVSCHSFGMSCAGLCRW